MAPPLGDIFSDDHKRQFVSDNLKVGAAIKFFCNYAQKEKRFIVVGERYDKSHFALVYINTEINAYYNPTPELRSLHLPMGPNQERPYVDDDCFVACNALVEYSRAYLENLMFHALDVHLGEVCEKDLLDIKNIVKTAKTIRPAKKKEFGLFL